MKIRNGFVSNSSSSSFIVQIEKSWIDSDDKINPMLADEEKIASLEKYGFIKTFSAHACDWKMAKEDEASDIQHYMGYRVSSNEEFVMAFLMKNNIPFKASCHYDHYFILFEKDEDCYICAHNFGNEIDTYGFKDKNYEWEQVCRTPKIERKSVRELIKENETYLEHVEVENED